MTEIVHISELSLEELLIELRGKITYQKGEYINIIFGNTWEVQIHKTYGTPIGINKTSLKLAIIDAIGGLIKEI